MKLAFYFSIAAVIILSGCAMNATIGTKIDGSKIHKIKTGTSTQEDVLSLMGVPSGKNTTFNETLWTYKFLDSKMSAGPLFLIGAGTKESSDQTLMVTFDKSNVVKGCIYRTGSIKASGGITAVAAAQASGGERETKNCADVH